LPKEYDVVELKRGFFRFSPQISREIVSKFFCGTEYNASDHSATTSRQRAEEIISQLRDSGLAIDSVASRIRSLSKVNLCPPSSNFDLYPLPEEVSLKNVNWIKYSYITRQMRPCKIIAGRERSAILLREEQPLCAIAGGRFLGVFIAKNRALVRENDVQLAMEKAHAHSHSAALYYEIAEEPFIKLYISSIWLPPKHRKILYEDIIVKKRLSEEHFGVAYSQDLDLIKATLDTLNIELKQGQPPEEKNIQLKAAMQEMSKLIQLSYKEYFKDIDKFEDYSKIVSLKDWDKLNGDALKNHFISLSNKAYNDDITSSKFIEFSTHKLPTYVDSSDWEMLEKSWKIQIDTNIEGVIIDINEIGHNFLYCKSIIPDFELLLGFKTTYRLEPKMPPVYWIANKWRLTPYAGRLKFKPRNSPLTDRAKGADIFEKGISRILGIPSIEQELSEMLKLDAFFLDLDQTLWKGSYELSRYFAGNGKLLEKETGDFDVPSALMEDIFKNKFYLQYSEENYLAKKELIELSTVGRWKRFVAYYGLINKLEADSNLPVFKILDGTYPRDVGFRDIIENSIAAILKYYGSIAKSGLVNILQKAFSMEQIEKAISSLATSGRTVTFSRKLHYVYSFATPSMMENLLNKDLWEKASTDKKFFPSLFRYLTIKKFFKIVHPLGIESESKESFAKSDEKKSSGMHPFIISSADIKGYLDKIIAQINRSGIITISARGKWKNNMIKIIEAIKQKFDQDKIEIILEREDLKVAHLNKEVSETHYRILVPKFFIGHKLSKPGWKITFKK
jgi:hypothetical protein